MHIRLAYSLSASRSTRIGTATLAQVNRDRKMPEKRVSMLQCVALGEAGPKVIH